MSVAVKEQRETQKITIRVVAISPVKEGGKMGKVRTESGFLMAWPNQLKALKEGRSYNVDITWNDAGTVRFIAGTPREVESQQVADKVVQTVQQAQKPRPAMYDPVKSQPHNFQRSHGTADATPERIFVCGGLNNAISSHQVSVLDVEAMITAVNNLRAVWSATLGAEE